MDASRLRARGQRRAPKPPSRASSQSASTKFNLSQLQALQSMYQSSPIIGAVRSILLHQLLSGGICLRREGELIPTTPAFQKHLSSHWLGFARNCIDSLLSIGVVAVAFDEAEDLKRAQRQLPRVAGSAPPMALAPLVVPLECCELSFRPSGSKGYSRIYEVHTLNGTLDTEARVHVMNAPDAAGNSTSLLTACFDQVSFVDCLSELALVAEASNARTQIVAAKRTLSDEFGAGSPFHDRESRQILSDLDTDASRQQLQSLQRQVELTAQINRLQTTRPSPGGGSVARGEHGHLPPPIAPSLFTLPVGHEFVNNASGGRPIARADLEALQRLSVEMVCTTFGVPPDMILNSKFDAKSAVQLELVNSTIRALSKFTSEILTATYADLYNSHDVQVELCSNQVISAEELLRLKAGGLLSVELGMPRILRSLGVAEQQVAKLVEEARADATVQ